VFNRLSDGNGVQSSMASCMKQFSALDVKADGSLSVKRCTIVFIGQQGNFDTSKGDEKEEVTSSNHIIVQECEDLELEIELIETPKALKDNGQATVDDLKELNLKTAEEPHPIHVSSLLTPNRKKGVLQSPLRVQRGICMEL